MPYIGRGSSFQVPTQWVMDAASSLTLRWVPRRSHLLVISANQRSTRFIQSTRWREVELEARVTQEPAVDGRGLVRRGIVHTIWTFRPWGHRLVDGSRNFLNSRPGAGR